MDQQDLKKALYDLPLGELRFFNSIGSTNDEALVWGAQGAPDLSLVVADEQTAGRGRAGRKWFTPAGSALAFSVILRPRAGEDLVHSRIVGLAALAVTESLRSLSLDAQIKWPNDILIQGKKVAGILLESIWIGAHVDYSILGIGLNVSKTAIPPPDMLNFPAISLEDALMVSPDRAEILRTILSSLLKWRDKIGSDAFIKHWEELLAFRGEQVQVWEGNPSPLSGKLLGLESDGSLRLQDEHGHPVTVYFGDVRLRPAV
jgi:BirA family biotin operon repressor/biotin-[acetyl-CoA-carboxylase] ligase